MNLFQPNYIITPRTISYITQISELLTELKHQDISTSHQLQKYHYTQENDLLSLYQSLMQDISDDDIIYKKENTKKVSIVMAYLFYWLQNTQENLLIVSCLFVYLFESISPFEFENKKIAFLWQKVILKEYRNVFLFMDTQALVKQHQEQYDAVLKDAQNREDATLFIEFILEILLDTLKKYTKESVQKSNQKILQKRNLKSNQKSDQKILTLIKKDKTITIKELSQKTKLSESGVKKILKKLKEEKILLRVGSLKGGYWEIANHYDWQ